MWTPRKAMKGILFSWILSAIFAMPQLYVWNLGWSPVLKVQVCIASFSFGINNDTVDVKKREIAYILYFAISQFVIPFCILVYLYVRIFMTVSESVRTKKSSAKNTHENSSSITNSVSFPSSIKGSKFRFRSSKKPDSLNKSTIPMLALSSNASDAITVTSSCVSIDRETKIRQNISKRSLSMLSKSKIKTFKLTLSVVAAFALSTLPYFTVQIILATIGKPETISNETNDKISCNIF